MPSLVGSEMCIRDSPPLRPGIVGMRGSLVIRIWSWRSLTPHKGNGRVTYLVVFRWCHKAPTRHFHSIPIAVSESGHTRKQNRFIGRCHPYARKSASQAVLGRMRLTVHATRRTPHGASRLVLAVSAWRVKTRRAPSRRCRDARAIRWSCEYGRAWDECTPPPPPLSLGKPVTV